MAEEIQEATAEGFVTPPMCSPLGGAEGVQPAKNPILPAKLLCLTREQQ